MFIALVVMCAVLGMSNARFLSQDNLVATSRQVAMLGIFSIGIAFVIATGGIDLSVGSIIGLTGVLIAKLTSTTSDGLAWPLWAGITVALGVAMLIGLVQGLLITRLNLQSFIVTLGGMLLIRGVSQTIVKGGNILIDDPDFRDFVYRGLFEVHRQPVLLYTVLVFAAVIVVAGYVLHGTVFGRYVYAIGGNRDAAEYSGIPVKNVEAATYVISAGLAGLAGVLYASFIGQMSQDVGMAYELEAIAAAVLGGVSLRGGEGTVIGVVIGVGVMRVIVNGINMFRLGDWRPNENWRNIIIGAVILIAVILDQVVHIVQARRRTRRAGAAAAGPGGTPPAPPGVEAVPAAATAGGEAERVGAAPEARVRESHV
jgi:ribose transport system permease protein